jgi:hypothetical protein
MQRRNATRERFDPPKVTLRTLREAHGLNLPRLAERIAEQGVEVTADHLSNCELGWKRPSNVLLHAWARALGIGALDISLASAPLPELLYVGSTRNLALRLDTHRVASFWARDVDRVVATVHPIDEAARRVERAAIREEHPRFNIIGRWRTHATWTVDQYDDYLTALRSRPPTHWKTTHEQRVVAARSYALARAS